MWVTLDAPETLTAWMWKPEMTRLNGILKITCELERRQHQASASRLGVQQTGHTMEPPILVPQFLAVENEVAVLPRHATLGITSEFVKNKETKLKARR